MKSFGLLALIISALAVAYLGIYAPYQKKQFALSQKILAQQTQNETLVRRIESFEKSGSDVAFPKTLLWPGAEQTDAELNLQGEVVASASQFGLRVSSFGSAPISRKTPRQMVAFQLEGNGRLGSFYEFLAALEQQTPRVAVGVLRLRPFRSRSASDVTQTHVYFQLTLWGFADLGT